MKRVYINRYLPLAVTAIVALNRAAGAAILITEVDPLGSSDTACRADWFELTNTGTSAVGISGWKMDDSSAGVNGHGAPFRGVSTIAAGQSVVFVENNTNGAATDPSTDGAWISKFENLWFGSNVPTGFTIGTYTANSVGNVGLDNSGDAVNIYDATNTLVANVSYVSDANFNPTLDNSAGLNNTAITAESAVGTNNAFTAQSATLFHTAEIGSPGVVPEPAGIALLALMGFGASRRKQR